MEDHDDADRDALAACRRGDRDAFVAIVQRYQRPLYNAALWIVRRPEDASDVTQAAFLKAIERLDDYDPEYRFFSWLYRIAVNEALDLQRRRGREDPLDDDVELPDEASDGPDAELARAQDTGRLRRCMARLSANDRAVLSLRHFSEMSYDEIADVLDLDEKTVKSRLFDARRRLRLLVVGS